MTQTQIFQLIWDPIFILLLGLVFLFAKLRFRWKIAGLTLAGLGFLVIYSSAIEKISQLYTSSVKVPAQREGVDAIVVLSGGTLRYNQEDGQFIWGESSHRILEAIRLFKRINPKWLVLSGDGIQKDPRVLSENESMKMLAIQFGIPEEQILQEGQSAKTLDHPKYLKLIFQMHQIKSFYVVSSDYHIPRVMKIFRREFTEPDLKFFPVSRKFSSGSTAENINEFQLLSKELIAYLVQ